ncbi:histamine N-methyltransferase-like isoform X1 [Glandiceps talaboti]
MAVEIKTLIHFPDLYFKKYRAIVKNGWDIVDTERQQDMIKTFENFDGSNVSVLRVLAVGSGNGLVDEFIIGVLSKKFSTITYVVVEPDKDELQKFKDLATLKTNQGQWQNVNMEFNNATIEEYREKRNIAETKESFHIVHAIQCAYHFVDPASTLFNLYETLQKDGLLLIVMVKGSAEKVLEKVGEYYYDPKFHFIGSTFVRKSLEERFPDLKVSTKYRKKTIVVNECFKEDSQEGNDMLDLFTEILDFRKTAPKQLYDDVMKMIDTHCIKSDGKIILSADEEDLIIVKV